jgi:uncharacterized protein YcfJ
MMRRLGGWLVISIFLMVSTVSFGQKKPTVPQIPGLDRELTEAMAVAIAAAQGVRDEAVGEKGTAAGTHESADAKKSDTTKGDMTKGDTTKSDTVKADTKADKPSEEKPSETANAENRRSKAEVAAIIAGGASIGALIGKMTGGTKGAAIGAISGAAGGYIYEIVTRERKAKEAEKKSEEKQAQ